MRRKITTYGGYFERFLSTLSSKEVVNFFIFDDGQIVVLFNGLQKKTQKTPSDEIEKALKIKKAYYGDKQS